MVALHVSSALHHALSMDGSVVVSISVPFPCFSLLFDAGCNGKYFLGLEFVVIGFEKMVSSNHLFLFQFYVSAVDDWW